jgi:hypothetical protein
MIKSHGSLELGEAMAGFMSVSLLDFERLPANQRTRLERKLQRRQQYLEMHLADVKKALKLIKSKSMRKKSTRKGKPHG